jgi:hypothetical protein
MPACHGCEPLRVLTRSLGGPSRDDWVAHGVRPRCQQRDQDTTPTHTYPPQKGMGNLVSTHCPSAPLVSLMWLL